MRNEIPLQQRLKRIFRSVGFIVIIAFVARMAFLYY
jgi:hypothetical protein